LLVAALAIGWWLGQREGKQKVDEASAKPAYFAGINYLLNEEKDEAIDSLISVLEKNSDSMDTHLVLAHMLRRRGEVERAIQIHQNLLLAPDLTVLNKQRINFELAQDYISVGLYDRAESLLLREIENDTGDQKSSFEYLLEIYQDTREWERAIEVSERLISREGVFWRNFWPRPKYLEEKLKHAVSHFYCELALEKFTAGEVRAAKKYLKRALNIDNQSVRANMQLAQLYMSAADYRMAIKCLKLTRWQDPELFPEMLPLLTKCYLQLGDGQGLFDYLKAVMAEIPSSPLVILLGGMITTNEGNDAAIQFIIGELNKRPSLRELDFLLDLIANGSDESIKTIQQVVKGLLHGQHNYRCDNCGFSGTNLHWHCPSCKQWGTIKPNIQLDPMVLSNSATSPHSP
jgi:lipopolysaccharide biosynthesis regulator YciM